MAEASKLKTELKALSEQASVISTFLSGRQRKVAENLADSLLALAASHGTPASIASTTKT